MRLEELHLLRFGHFTDRRLDLAEPAPGFHLIYGPNEAGKSTALRAVRALLFGVPQFSPDTFVHEGKDLRIGATLVSDEGSRLSVIRRKGRKNTLLTADEQSLGQEALRPFLGGVGESLFRATFGLDNEGLRAGAQALLAGEGNLSESLFGAGSGGLHARRVLQRFREEADGLFTSRGRGRKRINQEVAEVRRLRGEVSAHSTSASAYLDMRRSMEEAARELEELKQQRGALETERRRLERLLRILPSVGRRAELLAQLAALGPIPTLPPEVGEWRADAVRQIEESSQEQAFLGAELERDGARLNELVASEQLLALGDDDVTGLADRLGQLRKAEVDLPKRQAELRQVRQQIKQLLTRLGREESVEEAEKLRLKRSTEQRLRAQTEQRTRLDAALEERQRQQQEAQSTLALRKKELSAFRRPQDGNALAAALARAQRSLPLYDQVEDLTRIIEAGQQLLEEAVAALPGYAGQLAECARLAWPTEATIIEARTVRRGLLQRLEQAQQKVESVQLELVQTRTELRTLEAGQPLPEAQELQHLRAERDQRLEESPLDIGRLKGAIDAADDCADLMWRQAERMARQTALRFQMNGLEESLALVEAGQGEAQEELVTREREWIELWRPLKVTPRSPEEMLSWRAQLLRLLQDLRAQQEKKGQLRALEGKLAQVVKELSLVLEEAGQAGRMLWEDLPQLVERAQQSLSALGDAQRRYENAQRRLVEASHEAEMGQRKLSELKETQKLWRGEWARGVKLVGLTKDARPEEVSATLEDLGELGRRLDEAGSLGQRIAGMERDGESFEDDARHLLVQAAPQLAHLPVREAAKQLVGLYHQAKEVQQGRLRIQAQVERRQEELRRCRQVRLGAEERLKKLIELAGVADEGALVDAMERVDTATTLKARTTEIEDEILSYGEGSSLASLVSEAGSLNADAARARLAEIAVELMPLEGRAEVLVQKRTTADNQLRSLGAGAARAAEEYAAAVTRLKRSSKEYLRLRLSASLLSQEVERYREQNQGPILQRAGELFPQLTLDRYRGLRAGYDAKDEPILLCLRDEQEVEIRGLSDGTRDQLYLALRLASIERYMENNESMPLILDDVLIHFDDSRAAAALAVLGRLSERVQILFFTHHHRLRELAKESVDDGLLRIHQLGEG